MIFSTSQKRADKNLDVPMEDGRDITPITHPGPCPVLLFITVINK